MPTIKDIAVRAGVSHGTVSNVLNKRGNVSAEKIQMVEKAAEELGYKINAQAQKLRSGNTRTICVILPKIELERYQDLYIGLERVLRTKEYQLQLFCTDNMVYQEEIVIQKALSMNPLVVVIVSSKLRNTDKLFSDQTRFIFVERKVKEMPSKSRFVSFDYSKAGYEIARQCILENKKNIAVLCENTNYSNNKEFIKKALEEFENENCNVNVYECEKSVCFYQAFQILNSKEEYDAVITTSKEEASYMQQANSYLGGKRMPALYSVMSKGIGPSPQISKYELNYKRLGQQIARYIIAVEEGLKEEKAQKHLLIDNDGFYKNVIQTKKIRNDKKLTMLCIKNATSGALRMLIPAFERATGIQLHLVEVSYDELYKTSQMCKEKSPYDLIRIDMAWLSQLGDSIFQPLDMESTSMLEIKKQLIPDLPKDYYEVNGKIYALPFDACVQMLFYRKDLFENELIKREFYEIYKRKLEVPTTFQEYNEVARFFTKKYRKESPTRYGSCVTYGSAIVAACDMLNRYQGREKNLFDKDGKIQIDTKEMRDAIENYLETCQYTSGESSLWWGETAQRFAEGKTAMNILFSNYASDMFYHRDSKVVGKIAFAKVPGENPLLGGGAIGISKYSKKYEEIMSFFQWIYSEEIATTITALGGYLCNASLSKNIDLVEQYPWIEGMEHFFKLGWRTKQNIKGYALDEFKFESIFGSMIRTVVLGIESVEEALERVQKSCERESL